MNTNAKMEPSAVNSLVGAQRTTGVDSQRVGEVGRLFRNYLLV